MHQLLHSKTNCFLSILIAILFSACTTRKTYTEYLNYKNQTIGKVFPLNEIEGISEISASQRPILAVIWDINCGLSIHLLSLTNKIKELSNNQIRVIAISRRIYRSIPDKIIKNSPGLEYCAYRRKKLKKWQFDNGGFPAILFMDGNGTVKNYAMGLPSLSEKEIIEYFVTFIQC